MVVQTVAPAANAGREPVGTSVLNRDTARTGISEIWRVSLARLPGSSFCTTSQSSVRLDTFASTIQEHNQQIAIRSHPFEILRVVKG